MPGKALNALSFLNDILNSRGSKRELEGVTRTVASIMAVAIAIYHIYTFTIGTYDIYIHRSIHVGTILALCFLTYSFSERKSTRPPIIDILLSLLSLVITGYLAIKASYLLWERVPLTPGSLTAWEIFLAFALTVMLLEAGRRAMGNWLGLFSIASLIYAYVGPHLSGIWYHRGFSLVQVLDFTVFSFDGIFTIPIGVCSTYIILFVIFAALIQESGAGEFFTSLAYAIAGNARGGPAKVATIASGFMGSISGSAAANIATTGSVTIPMMKKAGFKPYFAGAVEAAASTGGHIMPPIMAGVVFIMAEIIEVPYIKICIASFVPAFLYYLGIGIQVHFYAVRHGIGRVSAEERTVTVVQTLKRGWQYFIPFIVIVGFLVVGYSPITACLYTLPTIYIASWFRKETRIGLKKTLKALESSVMTIRLIMLSTGLAGILMGVVFYSGLGGELVSVIRGFAGERLLPALLLAAVLCLVLGLPLSLSASYLLTAIFVIPATVSLGVPPMAAHLFAIYFASVAVITPPAGGAFFLAGAMAGAPPFTVGWQSLRLAFAGFVVPFFFVYKPALLLMGSPLESALVITMAIISIFFMSSGIEGWLLTSLNIMERTAFILGGFLLIFVAPVPTLAGMILIVGAVLCQVWKRHTRKEAVQTIE